MPFILGLIIVIALMVSVSSDDKEEPETSTSQEDTSSVTGPIKEGFKTAFSNWSDEVLEKPRALIDAGLAFSPLTPYLDANNLKFADSMPQCEQLIEQAFNVMGLREKLSALDAQQQMDNLLRKGVQLGCFVQKTSTALITSSRP